MADPKTNYDIVAAQEKTLIFDHFDYEDAWNLGRILAEKAISRKLPVAVEIVLNGYLVFRYGCPGSNISNDIWLQRKVNTVTMMQISTLRTYYMPLVGQDDICRDWHLKPDTYATLGGGFPITVKGTGLVGVAAVSGLPHHLDHDLVIDAISEYLGVEVERALEG